MIEVGQIRLTESGVSHISHNGRFAAFILMTRALHVHKPAVVPTL